MAEMKDKIKNIGKKGMPLVIMAASQFNAQSAEEVKQVIKEQHEQNQENLNTLKIVYDQGFFVIEDEKGPFIRRVDIEETAAKEMKNDKKSEKLLLKEEFSHPTEIDIENADYFKERGHENSAGFYDGSNRIVMRDELYNQKGEDIRKQMNIDTSNLSAEDIKAMDTAYEAIYLTSILSHEKKHRDNDKAGLNQDNISQEHLAKQNMMDEISANMVQAGVALNYYKTTGRMEGFDMLYCCGKDTVKEIKEYVAANKDKLDTEESKKFIAGKVRDGWLNKNNNYKSYYEYRIDQLSTQALTDLTTYLKSGDEKELNKVNELCGPEKTKEVLEVLKESQDTKKAKKIVTESLESNYKIDICMGYHEQARQHGQVTSVAGASEWIDDNSSKQEYDRRVKTMFSDIPGLGDVSAYVSPDFELNDELKRDLKQNKTPQMQEVINNAANGADNPIDAASNIIESLDPIKQATLEAQKDGIVTPEEQKNIDKVTYETIQKLRGVDHASAKAKKSFEEAPTQVQSGKFRAAMFDDRNSR